MKEFSPNTKIEQNAPGNADAVCSDLGRWHWWWLRQFAAAKLSYGSYDMGVSGWGGTVQGQALAGLMKRKLVQLSIAFETAGLLTLTPSGIQALAHLPT